MKIVSCVVGAGLLACTAASVHATGQGATSTQTQTTTTTSVQANAGQQVTITGCVQSEADYRRAHNAGQGGVGGTGVGTANEFVLVNASMGTAANAGALTTTAQAGSTTATVGTSGSGTTETAFELTGTNERQAATYVGQRVEVTGILKPTSPAATGGPTANVPLSQDLQLREIEVTSVRAAGGAAGATCSTSPAR